MTDDIKPNADDKGIPWCDCGCPKYIAGHCIAESVGIVTGDEQICHVAVARLVELSENRAGGLRHMIRRESLEARVHMANCWSSHRVPRAAYWEEMQLGEMPDVLKGDADD